MLEQLSMVTKEEAQLSQLTKICQRLYLILVDTCLQVTIRCTANDLCYIVRLIKHDVRIFAGAKTM